MKKAIRTASSLEFLFALFLLAGYFKGSLSFIRVDITLVLLLVTLVGAFFRLKKNQFNIPKDLIHPISFVAVAIVAMMYNAPKIFGTKNKLMQTVR